MLSKWDLFFTNVFICIFHRICEVHNRVQRITEAESRRFFFHKKQSIGVEMLLVLCKSWDAQMQSARCNDRREWRAALDREEFET